MRQELRTGNALFLDNCISSNYRTGTNNQGKPDCKSFSERIYPDSPAINFRGRAIRVFGSVDLPKRISSVATGSACSTSIQVFDVTGVAGEKGLRHVTLGE